MPHIYHLCSATFIFESWSGWFLTKKVDFLCCLELLRHWKSVITCLHFVPTLELISAQQCYLIVEIKLFTNSVARGLGNYVQFEGVINRHENVFIFLNGQRKFYSIVVRYTQIYRLYYTILPAILLKKKKYFSILSTSGNFHVMNQMIWERGLVQFPFVSPPYQTFSPSLFLSRPSLCSPSRSKIWQNLFFCNFFLEKTFFLYPTKTPWVSHKFVTSKR